MTAPALLDTTKVIVGASGSGKTVTAKHEVQQLLEQRRHTAIIDPTGVWWGMRSNAAGDGPGFDLPIFGGEHGDVAIRPSDGAAIARIIVEQRVSAIVDISGMDNSRDWRWFMDDFVAGLRRKPKGNFHLVLDEADEFAAQIVADDIGNRLRENLVWMAKRGRVQGFVPTYITQRTAEIAKAVISQAQTIVAHQLVAPTDQKAIDDYLKGHADQATRKELLASLAELEVGERWIYSPRLKILECGVTPALTTFDSSRTPAPGEQLIEPRGLAELDVSAIRAALAPPPADEADAAPIAAAAVDTAIDKLLQEREDALRRIVDLEGRIERADAAAADAELRSVALLTSMQGVIEAGIRAAMERLGRSPSSAADCHTQVTDLQDEGTTGSAPVQDHGSKPGAEGASPEAGSGISPSSGGVPNKGAAASPPDGAPVPSASGAAVRGRRALQVLVGSHPGSLTEEQWALIAGFTRKGGTWGTYKGAIRAAGLIEQIDGRWRATGAGIAEVGGDLPPFLVPGPALATDWGVRAASTSKLVAILIKRWPHLITRDALAADAGMSAAGGTFGTYLGRLRAKGLIEEQGKRLRLAPALMEKQ